MQQHIVNKDKFGSEHRLLRVDGFDRVVKAGNLVDKYLKLFFAENRKKNARLGIVASKRVFPRAVDRNRAKRLIREVFRQHSIKQKKLDMVVMLRHACSLQPGLQRQNLETLFSRLESRCADF